MPYSLLLLAMSGCWATACSSGGDEQPLAVDAGPDVPPGLPWVSIAPGGRYFESDDGEPFVPIGNQLHTTNGSLFDVEANHGIPFDDYLSAHFARMRSYGENTMRMDFDYTPDDSSYVGIESHLGTYDNPEQIAKIDAVFELATQHGVRILAFPWITSPPMWGTWAGNPFSSVAADPYRFLHDDGGSHLRYLERLEWVSERWAGEGVFFAWEIMNEADVLTHGDELPADGAVLAGFADFVGSGIAAFESSVYAPRRAHPRMMSWVSLTPSPAYQEAILRSAGLDMASTHPYGTFGFSDFWQANSETEYEACAQAEDVHGQVAAIVSSLLDDRRPYLDNERPANAWGIPDMLVRFGEHLVSWAELTGGAAGPGIIWAPSAPTALERWHDLVGPEHRALMDFVEARVPDEFFLSSTTDESFDTALSVASGETYSWSVRRGEHAIGWLLARQDDCVQVATIEEVLADPQASVEEIGIALLMWRKLLQTNRLPYEDEWFADFLLGLEGPPCVLEEECLALPCGDRDSDTCPVPNDKPECRAGHCVARRQTDVTRRAMSGLVSRLRDGLGALEQELGTCPVLTPEVRLAMPEPTFPNDHYDVLWIDDDAGAGGAVEGTSHVGGSAVVTAPPFQLHMAVVVKPAQHAAEQ